MRHLLAHSRLTRAATLLFVGLYGYSACAIGVNCAFFSASDALRQFIIRHRAFTETPGPVFKGANPRRDPIRRNGKWTDRTLSDLAAVSLKRRLEWNQASLWASIDRAFAFQGSGGSGGDGGSGGSGGGEGGAGSGGSGSGGGPSGGGGGGGVSGSGNTNVGNQLHQLPITSWRSKGQTAIALGLFHNSMGTYTGHWGEQWSSTYDMEIGYTAGSSAIVRWPDGTNDAYPESAGTFTPPVGVHDALVHNGDGTWTSRPSIMLSSASTLRAG